MANIYNEKLWILSINDIVNSPASDPVCIWKARIVVAGEGQSATLKLIPSVDSTTDHDDTFASLTFSGTNTITDAATGDVWDSTAAGDWMYITECSTPANNGWWYIKTDTDDNNQVVEIGDNIDGAHKFTNVTAGAATARVRTYSPEVCMVLQPDTIGGSSSLGHYEEDWGDKGKWFTSLSVHLTTSDIVYLYIK